MKIPPGAVGADLCELLGQTLQEFSVDAADRVVLRFSVGHALIVDRASEVMELWGPAPRIVPA